MKAEAKSWKVLFGRNMNTKFLSTMDQIVEMVDDYSKRLARPIKDLDDVRQAMITLKQVRENEIFIDSSLDPIEVGGMMGNDSVYCFGALKGIVWVDGEIPDLRGQGRD